MKDSNCIFCKIVAKEIPSTIVHEDKETIAFLDIHPHALGHTILIPKEHYHWFFDVPKEIASEWFATAQKLAVELKKEYQSDYIELKVIGTDVPHTHIHLIPRKIS